MSLLRTITDGLRSLFRKELVDAELDEELRGFLEMAAEEKIKQGMSRKDALRAVRLERGSLEVSKEVVRAAGWESFVETLWQDIRFAARMLAKNPSFTAVAVLTLALGMGANTAIFSVANGTVFRPLPVYHPEQIVVLASRQKDVADPQNVSYPDFLDYRRATDAFSDMLAYEIGSDAFAIDNRAEEVITTYVTGNYFSMLGIQPAVGRLISPNEGGTPGVDPVLVLGYSYWRRRFNADPQVIGKTVLLSGRPETIIGVAPKQFHGTWWFADVDAYLPLSQKASAHDTFWMDRGARGEGGFFVLGRLKPFVSNRQALASLDVVAQRLAQQFPATNKDISPEIFPERLARPQAGAASAMPLMVAAFLGLAAVVLIAATINVVNLVLARANTRCQEMAVRAALGASRIRLMRQWLTENLLLALAGAVAGIFLSAWLSRVLAVICVPADFPWFRVDFTVDWRVVTYALTAAVFVGFLMTLLSMRRASRVDLNTALHEGGRAQFGSLRPNRAQAALVVVQIAGSMVVLIIAGLLLRGLRNAERMDLGFDPRGVVNFNLDVTQAGMNEMQGKQFYTRLIEDVRALPGVQAANYAHSVPFSTTGFYVAHPDIEGYVLPPGRSTPAVTYNIVSPSYFQSLHMSLVAGRGFSEADDENAPLVAVINQAMAARFWQGENPIGKRFKMGAASSPWVQVIGVAHNGQYNFPSLRPEPYLYMPLAQRYEPLLYLQVRSGLPTSALAREVQERVRSMAPALPVQSVLTMEQQIGGATGLFLFRVGADVAGALGTLGLILAVIGVYGVMTYSVDQRRHEFGIRMALGAGRGDVLEAVLRPGARLLAFGLGLGMLLSVLASRAMGSLFWGVSATDPLTFAGVATLLLAVALVACCVPARRATRVDPMVALRYE